MLGTESPKVTKANGTQTANTLSQVTEATVQTEDSPGPAEPRRSVTVGTQTDNQRPSSVNEATREDEEAVPEEEAEAEEEDKAVQEEDAEEPPPVRLPRPGLSYAEAAKNSMKSLIATPSRPHCGGRVQDSPPYFSPLQTRNQKSHRANPDTALIYAHPRTQPYHHDKQGRNRWHWVDTRAYFHDAYEGEDFRAPHMDDQEEEEEEQEQEQRRRRRRTKSNLTIPTPGPKSTRVGWPIILNKW